MNGFGNDRLTFIHGDLADKVSGKFDIVVANIVADVIIMFCKTVPDFMADNAVFITSGIIDIREQEVVDAFAKTDLKSSRATPTAAGAASNAGEKVNTQTVRGTAPMCSPSILISRALFISGFQ